MSNKENELDSNLEDERRLEFTLSIREDIVSKLMAKGIPEDKSYQSLLVSTLDGMDRTILSRARIKSDNKISDSNAQAAGLIATLLGKIDTRTLKSTTAQREIPVLENDPSFDMVIGETDLGTQTGNFDTFMKKFPQEDN